MAKAAFNVSRTTVIGVGGIGQVLGINERRIVAGFFIANAARCYLQFTGNTGAENGIVYVTDQLNRTFTYTDFGDLVRGEWYCQSDSIAVQLVAFEVYAI